MVPQSDIQAFDSKPSGGKEVVEITTDFGSLQFESKVCTEIIDSMQKNIKFRPPPDNSEKGRRSDSSSFLKNNTSTEFKLSYDKPHNPNGSTSDNFKPPPKANSRPTNDLIKEFVRKWREGNFLSERFTRIIKNLPEKS